MPFTIVNQDITKIEVDAIVNAANRDLIMGGGVCGAIFRAAGVEELTNACQRLSPIETGQAVITPGFKLSAKYIIHTAGPVYSDYSKAESHRLLKNSYTNSLKVAVENNCKSVAFPLISSGIYGYPKDLAFEIAKSTILEFIKERDLDVRLALFG